MFIEQPPIWLRGTYRDAIWRFSKYERSVYLTFDDGPIPEVTPWVLGVLDHYKVPATFFMVGDNVRKHYAEYEMVRAAGHRIGNHTYNHMGALRHGIRRYLNNVELATNLLHTDIVRPPYGWLKWEQYFFLRRRYKLIMWDVVTRDYSRQMTAADVFFNVRRYTRPGSIITFHDSVRSYPKLVTALPQSIEWLRAQGYRFKPIPVFNPRMLE